MSGLVLFYYTLFVLLVSILVAALSLSSYLVSRQRIMALAAVGFLAYFFDVTLVFQDDFVLRGSLSQIESVYFVGSPLPSIVMGLGVFLPLWLAVCDAFEETRTAVLAFPGALFVAGSVFVLALFPESSLKQFTFYTMRGVLLFTVLAYAGVRFALTSDAAVRARLSRAWVFYAGLWALGILVVVENAFVMFWLDPAMVRSGLVPFFPERNFAENALMLWIAAFVGARCVKLLALHFKNPPADCGEKVSTFIAEGLVGYADHYGLTARETDVLRLVLSGLDNQGIASSMSVALSTVKAHVHSILKKTGQANRQELITDFRRRS